MTHRRVSRFGAFALGMLVSLGGGAAVANTYSSPGYEWGRGNCGPATGNRRTYASCVSCCMRGAQDQSYPADDAASCGLFCRRVPWNIWADAI